MKKNPYRLVEMILGILAVLIMVGMVFAIVHFTNSWRGFGLSIGIILLIIMAVTFLSWWASQRDNWDKKHKQSGAQ